MKFGNCFYVLSYLSISSDANCFYVWTNLAITYSFSPIDRHLCFQINTPFLLNTERILKVFDTDTVFTLLTLGFE